MPGNKLFQHLTILDLLLVFIPLAFFAECKALHILAFFSSCLAIIPLAGLMGRATEFLSERVGSTLGALLNATFGNACEFIIALSALRAGMDDIVKASITGSIIGNMLLVLGASMLAGGIRHKTQTFNRLSSSTLATLLALSATSLMVPSIFHYRCSSLTNERGLALGISIILFLVYLLSLVFSLKTHRHLYTRDIDTAAEDAIGITGWSWKTSISVLFLSTVLVAFLSEILVQSVGLAAGQLHMNKLFIGVVLVAIVGNAAEHSTAVYMAMKNKIDLAIGIALGSGAQIALFVAPLLVFISYFMGHPMTLYFSEFEVMAVVVSVIILGFVISDGECNWLEGAQLLAVYAILATAFYFL